MDSKTMCLLHNHNEVLRAGREQKRICFQTERMGSKTMCLLRNHSDVQRAERACFQTVRMSSKTMCLLRNHVCLVRSEVWCRCDRELRDLELNSVPWLRMWCFFIENQ